MARATKPQRKRMGRPPAGHVKMTISFRPEQLAALRQEAFSRSAGLERGRPDVSEVLRELVEAWMKRRA